MSRIGIKSYRLRVVFVFGQATECHLAFVREEIVILWVYYTIPLNKLKLVSALFGITFQLFKLLCLAKDH